MDSLEQESTRFLYKLRLNAKLYSIQNGNAEQIYNGIKEAIRGAANEALGQAATYKKSRQPEWWSTNIKTAIDLKKWAYNKWLHTKDEEDRKMYARMNREVKREVIKSKNSVWEQKCEKLDRYMGGTRVSEAWRTIRNLRKDTQENSNISPIDIQTWEKYFKNLLTEERKEFAVIDLPINVNTNDTIKRISIEEIRNTLKHTKNGKAAGPGDIPIELVKYGTPLLWEWIAVLMNKCMIDDEELPEEWNKAYLIPIYKKGDRTISENYRGISVTSSIGRLYGKIIKNRVEENLTEIEEQSGFRSGRSCLDNIYTLRQLLEKRTARNLNTHIIFIDLEKAYDNVPLSKLFEVLTTSNMKHTYVREVRKMYKNANYVVKSGGNISNAIKLTKGLKQGCCLSPTLFKIYIQKALENWTRKCAGMGIEINGSCMYTLLYADDQVITANDEEDVTYMLRKLLEEYGKWGLKINVKKTQHLSIGEQPTDIIIDTGVIQQCEMYNYLGSWITKDGTNEKDIENRIRQGKAAIQKLNSLLWSTKIKMKVKKTFTKP